MSKYLAKSCSLPFGTVTFIMKAIFILTTLTIPTLSGVSLEVPLSTLEGALVASTNRGCKALTSSGGVTVKVLDQGMTRGPLIAFENVQLAKEAADWLQVLIRHVGMRMFMVQLHSTLYNAVALYPI